MLDILTKKDEWDRTIKEFAKVDFYHFHDYHRANLKPGENAQLILYRNHGISIALPIVVRPIEDSGYFDVTSVYGYVGPLYKGVPEWSVLKEWQELLHRYFSDQGIVSAFSSLNPFLPDQANLLKGFGEIEDLGQIVYVDLTKSEDEQFAAYSATTKRYVKRNSRLFSVREGKSERDVQHFLDLYYQSMDRIQAEPQYYFGSAYFLELLRTENFDARFVFAHARESGEVAAGALIVTTNGHIVQYHLSGTSEKYRDLSPIRTVIDHVREQEASKGCKVFNLGGGVGSSHDTLYGFKASFSSESMPFKIWKYIVDRPMYDRLCAEYVPDPNQGKPNYFPRYRSHARTVQR